MLYLIKKIAHREGGFIILEEEGFINQQRGLFSELFLRYSVRRIRGTLAFFVGTYYVFHIQLPLIALH